MNWKSLNQPLGILVISSLGAACGAHELTSEHDESSVENVGTVTQGLDGTASEFYFSSSGQLTSSYKTVCVLSGVSGDFGYGSGVEIYKDGSYWYKRVQNDGRGHAICLPTNNFYSWRSGSSFRFSWGNGCWARDEDYYDLSDDVSYDCDNGEFATYLTWIQGELEGGGESARVSQSSSTTTNSKIVAKNGTLDYTVGAGNSMAFGSGQLVMLYGYTSVGMIRGTMKTTGVFEFHTSTYSGYGSYWLAPKTWAVCYLTKVGGDFDGGGEKARIRDNGGQWYLESLAGGGDVWASARCMAYNQG